MSNDRRWILYRPDTDRYLGDDDTWVADWKVARMHHWHELSLILQSQGWENRVAVKPLNPDITPGEHAERVETYTVRRVEVLISIDKLILDE